MDLPDLSKTTNQIGQYLPEVLYPSVDEAARANREKIAQNVSFYKANPRGIQTRLEALDEEWSVDKVLQMSTSGATIASFWFSLTKSRIWSLLPVVLAGGAIHYGVTGGSPAVDLIRRLGFRTRDEIDGERMALLAVRGDFSGVTDKSEMSDLGEMPAVESPS